MGMRPGSRLTETAHGIFNKVSDIFGLNRGGLEAEKDKHEFLKLKQGNHEKDIDW